MRHRRIIIPQRKPFFIGCEGESERSYIRFVGNLAAQLGLAIHLEAVLLRPGGGDPLALVELAARKLEEKRRKRGPFDGQFVLLDTDKLGQTPDRDQRAVALANDIGLQLIWQSTCHESVLLRHLDGCATHRPATSALAEAELRQRWPNYEKGMSAFDLSKRLDLDAVRRAANVEAELFGFVQAIGLIDQ